MFTALSRANRVCMRTCGIANIDARARPIFRIAIPEHAEIVLLEAAERDALNDRRREGAQQEQNEGEKENQRQWRRRSQHLVKSAVVLNSNECGIFGAVPRWSLARGRQEEDRAAIQVEMVLYAAHEERYCCPQE